MTRPPEPIPAREWSGLGRLWPFVRRYRASFAIGLVMLAASFAVELTGPWLLRLAIDGPIADAARTGVAEWPPVVRLGLCYLGITLAGLALGYGYGLLTAWNGQRVVRDVRRTTFRHTLGLSLGFFDRHPSGQLVTRITTDVENLNELIATGLLQSLFDLLKLVGIVIALFWIDPTLAWIGTLALPVLALISLGFRARARRSYSAVRRDLAEQNAFLSEAIGGVATSKQCGQQAHVLDRYSALNHNTKSSWLRTVLHFSVFFSLIDLSIYWSQGLLLWVGGGHVIDGSLSIGVFVQFWLYFGKLMDPIRQLGEKLNILQSALASGERIFDLLDQPPEPARARALAIPRDIPATAPLHPTPGTPAGIRFEGVSFGYSPAHTVVRDLEFTVPGGSTTAVVGRTGAGKSTLLHLAATLYEPSAGRIWIHGQPTDETPIDALRARIGLVQQDVFLFCGTLLDNVRRFAPDASEEQVHAVLATVGAEALLDRLPDGLATRMNERGVTLSRGERQLIAFARTLLQAPDLLLLDEATASMDSPTERALQDGMGRLSAKRTAIVVAHRLATVRAADQILVLHHGEIVQRGKFATLVDQPGLFRDLVVHGA